MKWSFEEIYVPHIADSFPETTKEAIKMIPLRNRFDMHRDLGQWSLNRYAQELGYDHGQETEFVSYLDGKRELSADEALMILTRHAFLRGDNALPEEITSELEKLSIAS